MSKQFVILATGGDYFLTACAVVNAVDEPSALAFVIENNTKVAQQYRLVAERVSNEEATLYMDQGALLISDATDLSDAF